MRATLGILCAIGLMLVASLACEQAGEILSPAEATQRAVATAEAFAEYESGGETELKEGDTVQFMTVSYLVLLRAEPGSDVTTVQSQRGLKGTVLGSQIYEDEVWYLIDTMGGQGWLPADSLEYVEPEGVAALGIGDVAYLTGEDETIDILEAPGSTSQAAASEGRGVEVTILQISELEGEQWYLVEASMGEGWVAGENLSVEAP
jgi:hypothetical protein